MRPTRIVMLIALAGAVAGCRDRSEPEERRIPVRLSRSPDTGAARLELNDGDIRITTIRDDLDLAMIGDSISSGLSPSALAKAKSATDTAAVKGTDFGADIERMVKGTVQGALRTRVVVPLSDVRDVRYDGQRLIFDWNGTPQSLGKVNVNGKDFLESFSPDDAQRFVVAVRARKREMGRR